MLDFLISPEANFETEETEKLLQKEKVMYVLSSESSYDLTALKKCAKKNSYIFPSRIKKNFFQLKGARRLFPWQRPRRRHPRELNELAHSPEKTPTHFLQESKKLFFNSKGLEDYFLGNAQEDDIQESLMN